MELVHCIYCSVSTDKNIDKEALDEILSQSRRNNEKKGVTGVLLYDSNSFFQVLEGDRAVVERLYDTISFDSRHDRMTKILIEPIEERAFGEWSMGYPKISRAELETVEGLNDFFSQGKSFIDLEEGRAKNLLNAFKGGKWRL